MSNKHILIFCQSPKDLKYILDIYEKNIEVGNRCSVIVREVTGVFQFIKTLNLDLVSLVFMNTFSMKAPTGIFKQLQEAKSIIRECNKFNYDDIYFFSNLFDVSTPYIIKRINSTNVYFYDHFKHEHCIVSHKRLVENIRAILIRCVFSLKTSVVDDTRLLRIDVDDFVTEKLSPEDVSVEARYMLKPQFSNIKSILFLDSNDYLDEMLPDADQYFDDFYKLFTSLGYNVVVKGHPRLGLSEYINNYDCDILEASIPSEFIDISNFEYIFSVCSASIVSFPNNISFSLIGYFEVINEGFYTTYLKSLGMADSQFISDKKEMARIFNL